MKEVNQIMESYVGIVRSNLRLTRAWNRLVILYEETEKLFKSSKATRELCELRNMINVGYLITRQAMERKKAGGCIIRLIIHGKKNDQPSPIQRDDGTLPGTKSTLLQNNEVPSKSVTD